MKEVQVKAKSETLLIKSNARLLDFLADCIIGVSMETQYDGIKIKHAVVICSCAKRQAAKAKAKVKAKAKTNP